VLPRRASPEHLFRNLHRTPHHRFAISVILGSEQREKEGGPKAVVGPSFRLRQVEPDVIDFGLQGKSSDAGCPQYRTASKRRIAQRHGYFVLHHPFDRISWAPVRKFDPQTRILVLPRARPEMRHQKLELSQLRLRDSKVRLDELAPRILRELSPVLRLGSPLALYGMARTAKAIIHLAHPPNRPT